MVMLPLKEPEKMLGIRHLQFFLLFLVFLISYGTRTILSVAIIAMTDDKPSSSNIITYPEWTNTNTILSSFLWGYILSQVIAGQLSERFGPKWFLAAVITISSVLTILVPHVAHNVGEGGVIVSQMIFGLSQGFIFPSCNYLMSRWTPEPERTFVTTFVISGINLGIALSIILTGNLTQSIMGWPLAFYLYGSFGLVLALAWSLFGSNSPSENPLITSEEAKYIASNIKDTAYFDRKLNGTPWLNFATSLPVWAILLSQVADFFGAYMLFSEVPSYLKEVMGFDMKTNSLYSALPYIINWFLGFLITPISKILLSKMSVTNTRKSFQVTGALVQAAAILCLAFTDQHWRYLGIFFIIVAIGMNVCIYGGFLPNHIDLAPNYSGTLFGICNSIATVASIMGPLSVDFFGEKSDPMTWRKVFCLTAGIWAGTGIFYGIFASAEVQPWNNKNKGLPNKSEEKTPLI